MNNSPKIFLAPVSSSELYKNYQKTVMVGIEKQEFLLYNNTSSYKKLLTNSETIRIWGIKNVKLTSFNKASIGDIVFFYHKGFIVGKADIDFKDKNQILSNQLWGSDFDKLRDTTEYWENILFLSNFSMIHCSFNILIDFANYSPIASVRSFNEYSPIGLENLLKTHISIDNFIKKYK